MPIEAFYYGPYLDPSKPSSPLLTRGVSPPSHLACAQDAGLVPSVTVYTGSTDCGGTATTTTLTTACVDASGMTGAPSYYKWCVPCSVCSALLFASTHVVRCALPLTPHGMPLPRPPLPHQRVPPAPSLSGTTGSKAGRVSEVIFTIVFVVLFCVC